MVFSRVMENNTLNKVKIIFTSQNSQQTSDHKLILDTSVTNSCSSFIFYILKTILYNILNSMSCDTELIDVIKLQRKPVIKP